MHNQTPRGKIFVRKSKIDKVPEHTLERLSTYLTILGRLSSRGVETMSSSDIEKYTDVNAAQFRKDLSYFGEFGKPGIGYDVRDLRYRIARILKIERVQPVLLVGAGNLGSALVGYPGLVAQNFHIVAALDNNPEKIGRQLWNLAISDIEDIEKVNERFRARMGIIAVPSKSAQPVADKLIAVGVSTILNFARVALQVPEPVVVRNVDLVQEMTILAFHQPEETE